MLARDVKDAAIDRLQRPAEDRYRMPPHHMRDLSEDEIALCIAVLKR